MSKLKIILGLAMVISVGACGWQVGSSVVANIILQDDMRDLASQTGYRIGLAAPSSEGELRNAVIRKAMSHGIELRPEQVTVNVTIDRASTADRWTASLAADYTVPINLAGHSFTLHFTPSSEKRLF